MCLETRCGRKWAGNHHTAGAKRFLYPSPLSIPLADLKVPLLGVWWLAKWGFWSGIFAVERLSVFGDHGWPNYRLFRSKSVYCEAPTLADNSGQRVCDYFNPPTLKKHPNGSMAPKIDLRHKEGGHPGGGHGRRERQRGLAGGERDRRLWTAGCDRVTGTKAAPWRSRE